MNMEFDYQTRKQFATILKNASQLVREGIINDTCDLGIITHVIYECIRGGFGGDASEELWAYQCSDCEPLIEIQEGDGQAIVIDDDEGYVKPYRELVAERLLEKSNLGICLDGAIRHIDEVRAMRTERKMNALIRQIAAEKELDAAEREVAEVEAELATETA